MKTETVASHQSRDRLTMIRSTILLSGMIVWFSTASSGAPMPSGARNIVLVHGALVDGSGWRAVYDLLAKDGYHVSVVQEPLITLAGDVAATRQVLDRQQGPVVLVGHSYGGAVITVAGDDDKVKMLVYIAALAPDVGESVIDLFTRMPSAMSSADVTEADGFVHMDPTRLAVDVAADLPIATTNFMAASQVPTTTAVSSAKLTSAAWRTKPSYGIVATDDKSINPDLERFMYKRAGSKITEIKASHAVYMSQPRAVVKIIEVAARAVQ